VRCYYVISVPHVNLKNTDGPAPQNHQKQKKTTLSVTYIGNKIAEVKR
jgi:hypothetical protein